MHLAALLLTAPLTASVPAPGCLAQPVNAARFAPGEALRFKLGVLGIAVGTLDLQAEAPPPGYRPRTALVLKLRAQTTAFVSTIAFTFDAHLASAVGPALEPLTYREDVDAGPTHRAQQIDFPAASGVLTVHSSKDGNPDPFDLAAGPSARDLVSMLFLLRGQPPGQPFCVEVLVARKLWRAAGQVAGGESIDTALGRVRTLRIDATAVRTDDASIKHEAHFWLSDDSRRLPLLIVAEVKGTDIRAELVAANGLGKTKPTGLDHKRVGAAIGR